MTTTLAVFAHLDDRFVPAGLLDMTETGPEVLTAGFRYGTLYLERPLFQLSCAAVVAPSHQRRLLRK